MQPNQFAKVQGVDNVLVRLQSSLDKVEGRQMAALSSVEESMESRMRRMRGVITDLGLDMAQLEAATPRSGVGGPFVPVKLPPDAGAFERQLYRINSTRAQVERLNRTLALVPYRKPVIGEVEFTSGFGVRSDPFLGRPAMHTGLDFRAATGDPVRATANGKVISSGWMGGYGRMVEIDHGNGLSTRYGHLSEINVKVGDTIKIGQVIGAVGSTGRSTGPHLHYETRIDGDAVDPQKFLRAGVQAERRLGAPNSDVLAATSASSSAAGFPLRQRTYQGSGSKSVKCQNRKSATRYSITSSASVSRLGGTLIPSCLAVLRLTTSQNLLACSIGRSPGFAPRTILAA